MSTKKDFEKAVRDIDDVKALLLAMESDPVHSAFLMSYKEMVVRYNQLANMIKALGKNLEFAEKTLVHTYGQMTIRATKCAIHKYDVMGLLSEFPEALEIDGFVTVTDKAVNTAVAEGKIGPGAIKHKIRREDLDHITVKGVQEIKI